ncbi:MAG: prevent-host-death protein [Candidatus Electronema sp. V4]|uniref:prevent-host-death protein n=1 Tax=Candidatus Electronema sp. V4 TaxID=3454756 RepID=UPI0040555595
MKLYAADKLLYNPSKKDLLISKQPCWKGNNMENVQYISDENNRITGVIVPIRLWRELQADKETAYLLKSVTMRERLLQAKRRKDGISFEDACEKLGI